MGSSNATFVSYIMQFLDVLHFFKKTMVPFVITFFIC